MTQPLCQSQDQSSPRSLIPPRRSVSNFHRRRVKSVFNMLVQREVSPNAKFVAKKRWGKSKWYTDSSCGTDKESMRDSGSLTSWVEEESLQHLSGKYCDLHPHPRSTIAAAFSSDGRRLASTHGDHTVKIIDCETGKCIRVLAGHSRTPWVVRFHPQHSEVVASGSLDQYVRFWNTTTAECIRSHEFYKPIASIAFHAEGELLAVASGHKLHMWHYKESSPTVVLKTRRSLRAVHFHPHGAPYLMTAEVNDMDPLDSSMSKATSMGYLRYPPPAIFFTSSETSRASFPAEPPLVPLPHAPTSSTNDSRIGQYSTGHTGQSSAGNENRILFPTPLHFATSSGLNSLPGTSPAVDAMNIDESQPVGGNRIPRSNFPEMAQIQQLFHLRDRVSWELPFLQGWLMAQGHGVANSVAPPSGSSNSTPNTGSSTSRLSTASLEAAVALLEIPSSVNLHVVSGRGRPREQPSQSQVPAQGLAEGDSSRNIQRGSDAQPVVNRVQSELANSIAASAAVAELPCTVKLRVWLHDIKDPCAQLKAEKLLLTIPHAVLCSEMGAHFSPCGRYLAACVACVLPHPEPGLQTQSQEDSGLATSPTRHPVTAHHVIYELRVYSLQKDSFGSVLMSRAIRAAHCLTSIQFSPTSEHILLAYGRRHGSLLKSIVSNGEATSHFFTVLEIYRVSDMELVRVLPSSEDEVNVACFHPSPGGGLIYGTKEGRLRLFKYDTAAPSDFTGPDRHPDENLSQMQTYALEC